MSLQELNSTYIHMISTNVYNTYAQGKLIKCMLKSYKIHIFKSDDHKSTQRRKIKTFLRMSIWMCLHYSIVQVICKSEKSKNPQIGKRNLEAAIKVQTVVI